jgi:taurine dioxygenase
MSSLASKQGPRYRHTADEEESYKTIAVEKLTPIIGAEVSGVDLASSLSNRTMDEIHRALSENLVIFFRDQHITPQQHLAFGRKFGELHIHPAAPHEDDDPALMKIYADKDSPRANGEGWHTDVSCDIEPPMGSILYIRQCPPRGGDTLFANMYAAYESLSDRMKTYLDGLTALHDGESTYRGLYAGVADKPSYPRAEHPVMRTHPVTGKRRCMSTAGSPVTSSAFRATRATPCWAISTSMPKTRCSSAASAGARRPSRSGIIAASSTARCGTTGRTRALARA